MSIKLIDRLSVRLALMLSVLALFVAAVMAYVAYEHTYQEQLEKNRHQLEQLVDVVMPTAAIAAYVSDQTLSDEVVNSLYAQDNISAVSLSSLNGVMAELGWIKTDPFNNEIHYELFSPFDKTELVGVLSVRPNMVLTQTLSEKVAMEYVVLIMVQSLVLITVITLLLNNQFLAAIKSIARQLHTIQPGKNQRVALLPHHKNDELGLLTHDVNQLLHSIENTLKNERQLRESVEHLERRFRTIFEQTSGSIALINMNGYILLHNPAFEQLVGRELMEKLLGVRPSSLYEVIGNQSFRLQKAVIQALEIQNAVAIDLKLFQNDKVKWLHCVINKIMDESHGPQLQLVLHDVSEHRVREQTLKIQAQLDSLTGLYNRRAGTQAIQSILEAEKNRDTQFAVLMIDLDKFKPVNDQYGHEAGDKVLTALAERFVASVREDDVVIRWGGDEFLVFIRLHNKGTEASSVAKKLLSITEQPIVIGSDLQVKVGASIGIAIYPINGETIEKLVSCADIAMYHVKPENRSHFSFYTESWTNSQTESE